MTVTSLALVGYYLQYTEMVWPLLWNVHVICMMKYLLCLCFKDLSAGWTFKHVIYGSICACVCVKTWSCASNAQVNACPMSDTCLDMFLVQASIVNNQFSVWSRLIMELLLFHHSGWQDSEDMGCLWWQVWENHHRAQAGHLWHSLVTGVQVHCVSIWR